MESQAEGKKRKEISTRKRRRASGSGSRSNSSEHSSGSSEAMATAAVSSHREAKMGKFERVTRSRSSNGMNGSTGCITGKRRLQTYRSRGESSSSPPTLPAAAPIPPAVTPSDDPLAGVVAARPREEPPQDNAIIPGLTDHLALYILALVPMSHHAPMKEVCSKWWRSLSSATGIGNEVLETRKASGIVEHWVFMLASGHTQARARWRAIDPVQNKTRWLPECPCDYVFDSCDKESAVAGTQLLVSGHSGEGQIVWKYDLHKDEWSKGPKMLHARCLFASASFGKYAYFAGGSHDGSFLKSAERYNSESQKWEALPDLHYSRRWCSGCILDGKFFVIGGQGGLGSEKNPLTSGEYYDEVEKRWVIVENMWPAALLMSPGQTAPPLVAVVDNELYCADATTMELKWYHKGTNEWRALGRVPDRSVDSSGWGMGFKAVGKEIFVIGGNMATGVSCDQIHAWPMVRSNGERDWRHVCQLPPQSGFIYNCAVMNV